MQNRQAANNQHEQNLFGLNLYHSTMRGDLARVNQLITTSIVNVNNHYVTNGCNINSLYAAAMNGHTEVVKALVNANANVDLKSTFANGYHLAPLYTAAQKGHAEIVKTLVDANASVDLQGTSANEGHAAPLYRAAVNGHIEVVKVLIDAKANVNLQGTSANGDHTTPLDAAALRGHKAIVKLLLKAGANIDQPNNKRATAVGLATIYGHLPVIEVLVEAGANLNYLNNKQWSPLSSAFFHYHAPVVEYLLKAMIQKARLPLSEADETIYSFFITELNKGSDTINTNIRRTNKEKKNFRADIRTWLVKALTVKVAHVIEENNSEKLQAELAGLTAIQSQVALLQGAGGRFGFFQEKTAMTQIKKLIEQLENIIHPAPVPELIEEPKASKKTLKLGKQGVFLPVDDCSANLNLNIKKRDPGGLFNDF